MGIMLRAVRGSVIAIILRRHIDIGCGLRYFGVLIRSCRRSVCTALGWDELTSVYVRVDVDRGVLVDVPVHVVAVVVTEFVIRACVVEIIIVVVIVEINGEHATVACVVLQHGLEIGKLDFSHLVIAIRGGVRLAIRRVHIERLMDCVVGA